MLSLLADILAMASVRRAIGFRKQCTRCGELCKWRGSIGTNISLLEHQGAIMSETRSRREFLRITASGMAVLAASETLVGSAGASDPSSSPTGEISVRVTDKNRKYASGPPLQWKSAPP